MAIEIVDFPMKNGGSFHSKMLVHQRVNQVLGQVMSLWDDFGESIIVTLPHDSSCQ